MTACASGVKAVWLRVPGEAQNVRGGTFFGDDANVYGRVYIVTGRPDERWVRGQ